MAGTASYPDGIERKIALLAAGKEAPITALPSAIPLMPVRGSDDTAKEPIAAPARTDSRATTAVHDAILHRAQPLRGDRLPNSSAMTIQPSAHASGTACASDAAPVEVLRHKWGKSGHAQVLPSLPGVVPRPLTLAEATAEAITAAAYKMGSTDNLAALVVDLQPEWRTISTLQHNRRSPEPAQGTSRHAKRNQEGPELSGEGADYSLPWHSTGLIIPQHGGILHAVMTHSHRAILDKHTYSLGRASAESTVIAQPVAKLSQSASIMSCARVAGILMRILLTSAGSGHVYQLKELVALVPRKATAGGDMAPAWPGVCRLPASHQRAIDEADHLTSRF